MLLNSNSYVILATCYLKKKSTLTKNCCWINNKRCLRLNFMFLKKFLGQLCIIDILWACTLYGQKLFWTFVCHGDKLLWTKIYFGQKLCGKNRPKDQNGEDKMSALRLKSILNYLKAKLFALVFNFWFSILWNLNYSVSRYFALYVDNNDCKSYFSKNISKIWKLAKSNICTLSSKNMLL